MLYIYICVRACRAPASGSAAFSERLAEYGWKPHRYLFGYRKITKHLDLKQRNWSSAFEGSDPKYRLADCILHYLFY